MAVTSMANSSIRDFTKFNNMADAYKASGFTCQYLIIAGGGGSSSDTAGGGGAGGYRSSVVGETSGGGGGAEQYSVSLLILYTQ